MHSCNGLLCIDVSFELSFFNEDRRLFVYNPTTGEYRTIPWERSAQDQSEAFNIVFDPSKSDHYVLLSVLVVNEAEGGGEFRYIHLKLGFGVRQQRHFSMMVTGIILKKGCLGMVIFIGSVYHQVLYALIWIMSV